MSTKILWDKRKITSHGETARINWVIQVCLTQSKNVRRVWFKEIFTINKILTKVSNISKAKLLRLLYISINLPYTHVSNTVVRGAPSCYLELLDMLRKWICRIVGPSLAAFLELLAHRRNVASLSIFYGYYFGRCPSELAQLVPRPFSRGRSTRYSDRLHDFSVTIPRCSKDVYVNNYYTG